MFSAGQILSPASLNAAQPDRKVYAQITSTDCARSQPQQIEETCSLATAASLSEDDCPIIQVSSRNGQPGDLRSEVRMDGANGDHRRPSPQMNHDA